MKACEFCGALSAIDHRRDCKRHAVAPPPTAREAMDAMIGDVLQSCKHHEYVTNSACRPRVRTATIDFAIRVLRSAENCGGCNICDHCFQLAAWQAYREGANR